MSIAVSAVPFPGGTSRVRGRSVSSGPEDALWAALASGLAGRPRVRVSRDGGRNYPARTERALTVERPTRPAAVMVYGYDGMARTLFLDLDSSPAGVEQVDADYRAITGWLGRHGAVWVEDISPSGGRHIYVPLAVPVPFVEAKEIVRALGARYKTLDSSPHSGVASGACRVPGSRHPLGGFQNLTQALGEAVQAVTERNPLAVWKALWASTAESREVLRAAETVMEASVEPERPALPHDQQAKGGLGGSMLLIATEGKWDASKYATPSHARMAVITAAARSGFTLVQIQQRMLSGAWPGLAGLYAKYSPRSRKKALIREWSKACSYVENSSTWTGGESVRKSDTSRLKTHPLVPHWLETWHRRRLQLEDHLPSSREGSHLRMVLRALDEAAAKAGTRHLEFGTRALAESLGFHASTVAEHLVRLGAMKNPLITRTRRGRGTEADTWTLNTPVGAVVEDAPRRPRKVFAVRPAFRELGVTAALAYEVLEQHDGAPVASSAVAEHARLSRTGAHEALESLSGWGLAKHTPAGWVVGARPLHQVAAMLGADQAAAEQHQRHREERRQWRAWLAGREHHPTALAGVDEEYPWWLYDPGDGDVTSRS